MRFPDDCQKSQMLKNSIQVPSLAPKSQNRPFGLIWDFLGSIINVGVKK